jgi:hypothetical protein
VFRSVKIIFFFVHRKKDMKVVCVCTEWKHYWLDDWLEAAFKWGYEPVVLGQGLPWEGFGTKMNLVREYTRSLPAGEIVAVVDCYDLLMTGPVGELLSKFQWLNKPVVIGAESVCGSNCKPVSANTSCDEKYVNGGFVMGKASALTVVYAEAQSFCPHDDQLGLCHCVNKHPGWFHLDHEQFLVCNLRKINKLQTLPSGRFVHSVYNNTPCAVHIPFIDNDFGLRNDFVRKHALQDWKPRLTRFGWMKRCSKRLAKEAILNPCYDRMMMTIFCALVFLVGLGLSSKHHFGRESPFKKMRL